MAESLLARRWRRRLGVTERGVHGLMRQVRHQVGVERRRVVQRRNRFAAVEHDRAQEPEVRGGQRPSILRQHPFAGVGIDRVCTAVWIVNGLNLVLGRGWKRQRHPNQAVLRQQAVRLRIRAIDTGTVGAVDVCEERILTAGLREQCVRGGAAQAHAVAEQVTGRAGASICAERLEEWIGRVDRAECVVGADGPGGIGKLGLIGHDSGDRERTESSERHDGKRTAAGETWSSSSHICSLRRKRVAGSRGARDRRTE